jgi:sporulation protein YlmC with PRC-barrel domain
MRPDLRVGALLGQPVYDRSGALLGRVADVETERDRDGRERIVALVTTTRPWGRLLGYERAEVVGPWLLEWLSRNIMRRDTRRVPWNEARLPDLPQEWG